MEDILLTIGIPTWNRANDLHSCLENIIPQVKEMIDHGYNINIFVSNNGSTDNTEQLMQHYKSQYTFIKYYKSEYNLGFKANVLNILEKADGKYVWFFGDDDTMPKNALKKIIDVIQNNEGINVLFGRWEDIEQNSRIFFDKINNVSNVDFISFMKYYINNTGLISCEIINKEIALNCLKQVEQESIDKVWPHLHIALLIIARTDSVYLYNEVIAQNHTGNNCNLIYTGIDFLEIFIKHKITLVQNLVSYIDISTENTYAIFDKVFEYFNGIWCRSAFLDSYYNIIKEAFALIGIINIKRIKIKALLYILPLLIPNFMRRWLYMCVWKIKGKYNQRMETIRYCKKSILNNDISGSKRRASEGF